MKTIINYNYMTNQIIILGFIEIASPTWSVTPDVDIC